jgi:hypothetical protein
MTWSGGYIVTARRPATGVDERNGYPLVHAAGLLEPAAGAVRELPVAQRAELGFEGLTIERPGERRLAERASRSVAGDTDTIVDDRSVRLARHRAHSGPAALDHDVTRGPSGLAADLIADLALDGDGRRGDGRRAQVLGNDRTRSDVHRAAVLLAEVDRLAGPGHVRLRVDGNAQLRRTDGPLEFTVATG